MRKQIILTLMAILSSMTSFVYGQEEIHPELVFGECTRDVGGAITSPEDIDSYQRVNLDDLWRLTLQPAAQILLPSEADVFLKQFELATAEDSIVGSYTIDELPFSTLIPTPQNFDLINGLFAVYILRSVDFEFCAYVHVRGAHSTFIGNPSNVGEQVDQLSDLESHLQEPAEAVPSCAIIKLSRDQHSQPQNELLPLTVFAIILIILIRQKASNQEAETPEY